MARSDIERIATLETKVDELDRKVVQVLDELKELRTDLQKTMTLEQRVTALEAKLQSINISKWLTTAIAAIATSAITFLVIEFLEHTKTGGT